VATRPWSIFSDGVATPFETGFCELHIKKGEDAWVEGGGGIMATYFFFQRALFINSIDISIYVD
jgi:hypothetical protein